MNKQLIFKIPQVRVLDYRRVKQKERAQAKKLFEGKSGKKLLSAMGSTFVPGEDLDTLTSR